MTIGKKLLDSTGLASLMQVLGASSAEVTAAASVLDDLEISKAAAPTSTTLKPGEVVADRWNEGEMHKVPGADKLKVGPTEHSSGGGAEKMVRDYSSPAPQTHLTMEAEQLAAVLHPIRSAMKAMGEAISSLAVGQSATTQVLTAFLNKAASAEEEGAVPGEAAGFATWQTRKAGEYLRATKSILGKAAQIHEGLDEAATPEARKAIKGQFRDLRKKAARLGLSALAASYAAKSEDADPAAETRKAIHDMMEGDRSLKADIAALHDKDREKDEEKRAKKAMKKMAKKAAAKLAKKAAKKTAEAAAAPAAAAGGGEASKSDDKGHQADKQDKDTKNQDDSAKKALEPDVLARVEAALKGIEPLAGRLPEVLEILAGRPVTNNVTSPMALMKADAPAETLFSLDQKIDSAVAANMLDQTGEMRARDLLQKITLVKAGHMSEEMWKTLVKQSPITVQDIFREAA